MGPNPEDYDPADDIFAVESEPADADILRLAALISDDPRAAEAQLVRHATESSPGYMRLIASAAMATVGEFAAFGTTPPRTQLVLSRLVEFLEAVNALAGRYGMLHVHAGDPDPSTREQRTRG